MKKVGFICLALVLALGSIGVAYAMWDKTLYIDTTVNTGEVDAEFVMAFTDDDGVVNNPDKDAGDDGGGTLYDHWGPESSNDPMAAGPNPPRYEKDVGKCWAEIDAVDPQILHFYVENGYPCYWNTLWFDILNTGTVPVNIEGLDIMPVGNWDRDGDGADDITVGWSGLADGMQIDPGLTAQGDIHIHVEQTLTDDESGFGGENEIYEFTAEIWLVQWNEPQP